MNRSSVSSSSSAPPGSRAPASRPITWSGNCGSSRLVTERLTATVTGVPCACQAAPCRIACCRTARGQHRHEPAALGLRQEPAGRHEAGLRVLPAHERLDAHHRAGPQGDLRLVVQDQLAVADRPAQPLGGLQPRRPGDAWPAGTAPGRPGWSSPRTWPGRRAGAARWGPRRPPAPGRCPRWPRSTAAAARAGRAGGSRPAGARRPAPPAVPSAPASRTANSSPPMRATTSSLAHGLPQPRGRRGGAARRRGGGRACR